MHNTKKLTCLIAFIFILLSLITIIFKNTANGYEISIYDAYPIYFWLFLIISIFCGFMIIVIDSLDNNESKWWKIGFFIVIFSNLIILLLPFFRGYFTFGRGDVLTHIGYSIDIINTGHFVAAGTYGENCYPLIHILISSINQLTELSPKLIVEILPILFIFFYMISIYLLSKEIIKDNNKSILITAFGLVLMFKHENLMLAPSVQTFFLLPFILLIFYKSYLNKEGVVKYSLLLVLMLLLVPFFHPGEGSLYLIPMFIGIYISVIIYNKLNVKEKKDLVINRNVLNVVAIILVTWATWFFSFSAFGKSAGRLINWVRFQSGDTKVDQVSNLLGKVNLSTIQFINLVINSYGQQLIYISLGALIAIIILLKIRKNYVDLEKFTFSMLFFIFIGLCITSFFNYTGVDSFRGIRYLLFVSTMLIGIFSYDYVKNLNFNYKKIGTALIISVIMISSVIGIFNTYDAPNTKTANFQVTKMELTGTTWFLENRNKSLNIESINPKQVQRFSLSVLGLRNLLLSGRFHLKESNDHFNYTNVSSDKKLDDNYYIDWKLNRIFYSNIYPEYRDLWKYTPNDFYYLDKMDNKVNSIYSNGEYWVYYRKIK